MDKYFFYSFYFLLFFKFLINIHCNIQNIQFDNTKNIILFDNIAIYSNENENLIVQTYIEEDDSQQISFSSDIKNKTLIKISNESFILFALNTNNNKLLYNTYKVNPIFGESTFIDKNFNLLNIIGNYTIKNINNNDFLIFYMNQKDFYLYSINLNGTSNGGLKKINLENENYLNNIDCDSYNGINIFCVYTIINLIPDYSYYMPTSYYSFININDNILLGEEIRSDIMGPALLKFEYNGQKKFLVCYYENSRNSNRQPSVYCLFFITEGNKITRDKSYFIGNIQSSQLTYQDFPFQNAIQLIKFENSIYIHLKVKKDQKYKSSLLFVASLDLNLVIPFYIDQNLGGTEKKNIFVNNKYILFLTEEKDYNNNNYFKINFEKLQINCPSVTLYQLSDENNIINLNNLIEVTKDISDENIYISFDLDPLTDIKTDNIINMGGLLNDYLIKEKDKASSANIILQYNENIKITYNYYIYHTDDMTSNSEFSSYELFSNFCLLKVLSCYKSCQNCSEFIAGTNEKHLCTKCKNNNYYKYLIDKNDTKFFNCYNSEDSNIEHYYLDTNDNQYHDCNESCKTCKNNKSCEECQEGYYFIQGLISKDLCYRTAPIGYYFDLNQKYYKICFDTCSECIYGGNQTKNNCTKCKTEFKNYNYDESKCTTDYTTCKKFWKINNTNDIECINSCDGFIILEGTNKNQCVSNCQSYINPFSFWTYISLLFYSCEEKSKNILQKYCITQNFCNLKGLKNNSTTCYSPINCFEMNDTTKVIPSKEDIPGTIEEATVVKYYEFSSINIPDIFYGLKNISEDLIKYYLSEYEKESNSNSNKNNLYFITVNTFSDFIVTIYPLNKEEYLYKNVIKQNKLIFVKLEEYLTKSQKIIENKNQIGIGLIEFKNNNIPINSINYFFFEYEKNNFSYNILKKSEIISSISDSSLKLSTEYPLYNFENSQISDQYSKNLISTIQILNSENEDINFFSSKSDFYTDICKTFTSEVGTDMTILDRLETYSTKLSLCEIGCEFVTIIDKGRNENPRAVCECDYKENLERNLNSYNFDYEKSEGKDVSNINVLKCGKNVFNSKEIQNNLIFWIFIFFIIIFIIIFLIIIFFGNSSIEDLLKIKQDIPLIIKENDNENENKESIFNISEKVSSINSDEKDEIIPVKNSKDNSNNSKNEMISIKKSNASPPKKLKEKISLKTKQFSLKTDNNSNNTTNIYFNKNQELKFKEIEDDMLDEIYPNYDEVIYDNYYNNKYMKNNFINLKLKHLKLKKYFMAPLKENEIQKQNNTDTEDEFNDINFYHHKKKRASIKYYKTLLPKAKISENILYNNYLNPQLETEYDSNKKKAVQFFEDSYFLVDKNKNLLKNQKESKNSDINISENNQIFSSKKNKSLVSSNFSNEKKLDNSSFRNLNKSNKSSIIANYLLNTTNTQNSINDNYSFFKFYWNYLNKREFCLESIYNMKKEIVSYIRISTFLFVISILLAFNCLLFTSNQIHERYTYTKEKGSISEFSYIFQKEFGFVFLLIIIYLVIKMIFIKLIYGKIFRIYYSDKKELSPQGNFKKEKEEKDDKDIKRKEYIKKYKKKSFIYIGIIFVLMILFGFISICYFGIFKNSNVGMLFRFFISFIFSIVFCAILCLIVTFVYHLGRKNNNITLLKLYRIFQIIY